MKLSIVDEKNEKEPIPPVMIPCALQLGVLEVGSGFRQLSVNVRPPLASANVLTVAVTLAVTAKLSGSDGRMSFDPTSRTPNWSAHRIITGGIGSFSFFSSTMDNFIYN